MNVNWWPPRRQELLTLAEKQCPLYVYSEETLNDIFFDLLSLESLPGLFYPLYANSHPKIRQKAFDMGLGFLCASTDELTRLLDQFPGLDPGLIAYLDDDPALKGYESVSQYGPPLIVKDPVILERAPAPFPDREIYLFPDLENTPQTASRPGPDLKGLYINQNRIFSPSDDTNKIIAFLNKLSGYFPETSNLILGNGGTTDLRHQEISMQVLGNHLEAIHEACPQFTLLLEVPLDLLSTIGGLMVKVLERGVNKGEDYIRVNMDLGASLYDRLAENGCQIVDLSKSGEEKAFMARIMGPDQDFQNATDMIKLPASVEEGDILLLTNMGVYDIRPDLDGRLRNDVPECYLSARRICQVKI